MEKKTISFMLVGVGGQGTILASNVLAELGLNLGYDVKQAEVHGMSQRGGSVTSHVRWSEHVYSPIISQGDADILIAFEKSELGHYIRDLKPGGMVLVNNYSIVPITVSSGGAAYPTDSAINDMLHQVTDQVHWVKGVEIAEEAGSIKAANVVLLGALAQLMGIAEDQWLPVITKRVPPKSLETNRKAFLDGMKAVKQ
ncbi:MAG: indolepyruvate oxidoreductase subunit beta [Anaerolineaceae bacterium]